MKLTLSTKDLTDGFFEEAKLLGIVAPMKDYQFCWQINNLLKIDFRINHDLEIQLKKKERNYFFSVYEYAEKANCLKHYLYNNQYGGEFLLPEFRHLDFLWLLKDDYVADDALQELVQSIRVLNGVQLVIELTDEKIRHKEHLIF